jgi:uncharacterized protein (DUF433 family)
MSDSKQNVGQQDRIRIDANDKSEVEYVHQQYPHLSHQQVLEAIRSKGPIREDVINYLNSLGKS